VDSETFFRSLKAQVWVTGSHMYGLATPESDVDYTGVFQPVDYLSPLVDRDRTQTFTNPDGDDFVAHTAAKFAQLAVKGNFNILDLFFHEPVVSQEFVQGLVAVARPHVITRNVLSNYMGYISSQKGRDADSARRRNPVRQAQQERVGYDGKYLSHMLRGIYTLSEILKTGTYHYLTEVERGLLLQVKRGEITKGILMNSVLYEMGKLEALYDAAADSFQDTTVLETVICDYFLTHS
jgi:predicted nucleotidyltransferase